jgi:hypothetical protein
MENFSVLSNRHPTDTSLWNYFPKNRIKWDKYLCFFHESGGIFIEGLNQLTIMSHFYYSPERGKKRFILEDFLDSEDFDFLETIASDVDQMRLDSAGPSELCLSVINASLGNA